MNSRNKGKRGEAELAKVLRQYGYTGARRGQQYRGSPDSPDVTGIEGVHIECKRVERLDLYAAMEQSKADAGADTPVVMHRKNGKPWLVTMELPAWIEMQKRN